MNCDYDYEEKCASIFPFIPSHVKEYLGSYEGSSLQPKSIECYGVAMMVDVSGYSKLASNLAQRGSIGPELLSNSMNGYLDKMIKIILKYKGDLVKFAGDAVVICWTMDEFCNSKFMQDEYEEMKLGILLNAIQCSLQMLTELSKYVVEIDNLKIGLSIHIGLGLGPIYHVHVGGYPGRWEHFISGSAVNQVGSILDLAKAGQIALSVQFYKLLVKLCPLETLDMVSNLKGAIIMESTIKNVKQIFLQKSIFEKLPNILNIINERSKTGSEGQSLEKERANLNNVSQAFLSTQNKEIQNTVTKLMNSVHEKSDIMQAIIEYMEIVQDRNEYDIEVNINNSSKNNAKNENFSEEMYNKTKEYINEGALSKIESGTKNLIKFSELRRITTVFVKISNIKFENSNDLPLAQESLDAVQRALVLQEGILRQFLIDDKGAIILIYFGLPPLSHENDAQVGIEAALEICKNMKRVNDNFTIGVGTGITWVGGIGNEDRADYSVVGDSVNMAARLMMKAEKNTILCDEETYKLTKEIISYKSKGSLMVKGKSQSISAYQPVNTANLPIHLPKITTEIELIGREKEIEIIDKLLVNYSTKCEGKTLLVQGVEGLGLMPLAELLIKEAKKNNLNICATVARKLEKTTIFSAYRSIIIDVINICQLIQQKKPIDRAQVEINKFHSLDSFKSSKDEQYFLQDKISPRSFRLSISSKAKANLNSFEVNSSCSIESNDTDHNIVKEKKVNYFNQKIMETLSYLGEDPELVCLFSLMFPNLIHGSDISDEDNENRISEFSSLLARIITKLSYKTTLIFVIDQLQYLDPISWKFTELLYKSPAKILLCLFTCPESYYSSKGKGLETLKNIAKSKRTVNIVLGSVSEEAACEIIKDLCTIKFQKKCTGVSESILKVIFERTQGTPIYIRRMTTWMLELPYFRLSSDGSLTLNQKDDNPIDLETLIPSGDIESIVVAQFDKLNSDYQDFLKVASVVGQFKVIDIKNFISCKYKKDFTFLRSEEEANSYGEDELSLESSFKDLDKYGFLKLIYQDNESWLKNTYEFSSDMIQKAIYTINTFSKREEVHLYFAHFFEQEYLANPDRQDLLVSIYEHYSHSTDKQKTKIYLEKVCKYYFKLKSMQEAIKYYRILFKLFKYEQYSTEISSVSNWTLSEWHKQIGEAYLSTQKYKEAENHIIISLRLMDVQIPIAGFNLWWLLKKVNRKNNLLYQKNFEPKVDSSKKEKKYKVIRGCLLLLSEIYNYLHKQNLFKLSIKMALSWSSKLVADIKYILILSLYGMELISNAVDEKRNFQVGIAALNKVRSYMDMYENVMSYEVLLIHDSLAQSYFILGDWKNALIHLEYLIKKSRKLNELALWDKGVIIKAFTEFHSGNTELCLKTSTEMITKRKSWKNQCLAYGCIFMNFILQNEEEDIMPSLSIMKKLSELAEKLNSINYSIQLVFLGIVGQTYYRFGACLIDNVLNGLGKIVKYLDKLGHPSWGALISFNHILDLLYYAYDNGVFILESNERTICLGILFTLINTLEKHFASYFVCIPILALARGLCFLISGEYELAIDTWKSGIIDPDEVRPSSIRLPYFSCVLYGLIKKYTTNEELKSKASKAYEDICNYYSYSFGDIVEVPLEKRHTCIIINNNLRNKVYSELLNKSCTQERSTNRSVTHVTQQQNVLSLDMKSNLINENIHHGIPDRVQNSNKLLQLQSYQKRQVINSNINMNVSSANSINMNRRSNLSNL